VDKGFKNRARGFTLVRWELIFYNTLKTTNILFYFESNSERALRIIEIRGFEIFRVIVDA
jgi:hypothetical protein